MSLVVSRPASSALVAFDRLIICSGMVRAMVPERSSDNDEEEDVAHVDPVKYRTLVHTTSDPRKTTPKRTNKTLDGRRRSLGSEFHPASLDQTHRLNANHNDAQNFSSGHRLNTGLRTC
jgi:hypothetical protein